MNRAEPERTTEASAERIDTLLKEARKRPGVAELLDVCQSWQEIETTILPHRFFMGQQFTVSATNSSDSQ